MQLLASDLYLLRAFPPHGVNVYLTGGILIDAGTRWHRWSIVWQLRNTRPIAHALTHAHPDHQGASHAICSRFGVPLWCGAMDASAVERGTTVELLPDRLSNQVLNLLTAGPPHRVTRTLREGDRIGDFMVIETPGHTPGHISFWREADRSLILGDVLANNHPVTQIPGLIEPLERFTLDPGRNRVSARKVAALRPRLVCFGHGPPLRDADRLQAFVDRLPH